MPPWHLNFPASANGGLLYKHTVHTQAHTPAQAATLNIFLSGSSSLPQDSSFQMRYYLIEGG